MQKEQQNYSNIDALLVHVMGAEPDEERPHLRGRSIVWAATYLAYAHRIPHLVFSGQHFWGEGERPPLGLVTSKEAIRELNAAGIATEVSFIPDYPVWDGHSMVMTPAQETSGEVNALLAFAGKMNLHRLASISSETHLPTIQQLYKRRGVDAKVISAEDVLLGIPGEIGHTAYRSIVDKIHDSDEERWFRKQERLKRVLYAIPGGIGEKILREKAKTDRKLSTHPTEWTSTKTAQK